MKKFIILAAGLFMGEILFAQTALLSTPTTINKNSLILKETETTKNYSNLSGGYSSFTRGSGFFIRPEIYRGLFATFGYQINPFVQTSLSIGYGDGLTGSMGVRAYTADANWAAMFDLRFSLINFGILGTSLAAGASYKDLDFGVGGSFYTDGYYYLIVPLLTVGWNIRCYDHR